MTIIKLDATNSTNTYMKDLINNQKIKDYTSVVTNHQAKGRGQFGTKWISEAGKNLTFSVYKDTSLVHTEKTFFVSMVVAISIVEVLEKFNIPNLRIKWPNDILSGNMKICGILIENIVKKNKLNASVIGVGLNTNQTSFENIPKASSIGLIVYKEVDNDSILKLIVERLKQNFELMNNHQFSKIKSSYENLLFRKNKLSVFEDANGNKSMGIIQGVSEQGKLIVLEEDKSSKEYDLKEISLIY